MDATVRLRMGDLFDGAADLIVLPCSTSGTITGYVARSLVHYAIPHPGEYMRLGEVEIMPFEGADDIAQYVAFAASVDRNHSTAKAIESIGAALGRRGMDLPQWMCNELAMAKKVIVVCDEAYKLKADGRLGGVGWETMIIQGDLSSLSPESTKYQVVVRADTLDKGLPIYLTTRYAFHAPNSDGEQSFRRELLQELLDMPIDPIPEKQELVL